MQPKRNKKIIIYFFLFFLLGSINNINLNQTEFNTIKKIKISGLNYKEQEIILKDIYSLNLENIFFLNGKELRQILSSNTLVENFKIYKKYPSTLLIEIQKTYFLAQINKDGKIFLIGSNGKLSKNNIYNNNLPYVFGKPKIKEFLIFKDIIDRSKFSYEQIKNLYFFPSKRWDLELKNNIIIKLSNKNILETLNYSYDFLENKKTLNIKIIDARIKKQIILNE